MSLGAGVTGDRLPHGTPLTTVRHTLKWGQNLTASLEEEEHDENCIKK